MAEYTITVGSGKDYATPQEAWNSLPSTVGVADIYNIKIDAGVYSTLNCQSGGKTINGRVNITPAAGDSWYEQIDLVTDPLEFSNSLGVVLTGSVFLGSVCQIIGNVTIDGLQIESTADKGAVLVKGDGWEVNRCIVIVTGSGQIPLRNQSAVAGSITNNLFISDTTDLDKIGFELGDTNGKTVYLYNNGIICVGGGGGKWLKGVYGNGTIAKNNFVFGFSAGDDARISTSSSNNCTDLSAFPGSNNLLSQNVTDHITSLTLPDARVISTSSMIGGGVDTGLTHDITGQSRSVPLSIGIQEEAASATDTTAPILSAPTGSATSDTTANGGVSTDEGNGTLYAVVTTSSTAPSVAQIQAGQDHTGSAASYATSQAVSAAGVQNVSATGLSPSTTYYWHYQQQDAAGNDSTVVSSESFTTPAASDTTPDAFTFTDQTGASLSTVTTSNSITVTGIDASAPISITGGEYAINGGSYTSSPGTVSLNDTVTLRVTSSGSYSTTVDVTLNIGGVTDTWSVTTQAQPVGTLTLPPMKNNTGTVIAGDTGITIDVYSLTTGVLVERFTGETTDASGVCSVSSVNLVAATAYTVVVRRSNNAIGCAEITAT